MIDNGDANMLMRENTLRKPRNIFHSGCLIKSYVTNTIELNMSKTNKSSATILNCHLKRQKSIILTFFSKKYIFKKRITTFVQNTTSRAILGPILITWN